MKIEEKKRRERSDKKRDVKPTLPIHFKDAVFRLSYITNTPVKDVAEYLVVKALDTEVVIEELSSFFKRDYVYKNAIFLGQLDNRDLRKESKGENFETDRLAIRFKNVDKESIDSLAFSLNVTSSLCTAYLIRIAVTSSSVVNNYLKEYLEDNLNQTRMRELEKALAFINKHSPGDDTEEIGWIELLSYFAEEMKESKINLINGIKQWLNSKKSV